MRILITNSAYRDLESIKEYYASEGVPQIGEKYVLEIVEHIETLLSHPEIGRQVPEFETPTIRELIHAPFRVIYLREKKVIRVVRIWRNERKLVLPGEREET